MSLTDGEANLAKIIGNQCGESIAHVLAKADLMDMLPGGQAMARRYVIIVRDQLNAWLAQRP